MGRRSWERLSDPIVKPIIMRAGALAAIALSSRPAIRLSAGAFEGAGEPRPGLLPEELPGLLMRALKHNNFPEV